jgi:chemotaxis protein MotA
MKFNISWPLGLVLAFGMMVFGIIFILDIKTDPITVSINMGALMNFFDVTSIFVTVFGTIATMFCTFPAGVFARMMKHFPILLGLRKQDPLFYINVITELSQEARKKGLLALEDSVSQYDDAFLKSSVMMIVDAMEPDKVREQLENELNNIEARHAQSWDLYDKGAALAPGFGMLGTLIGLINMLANMNFEDEGGASKLATDMAVALITTFYGSIMANVIFIPIASQLRMAHSEEMLCKEIIIEGVASIQAGENPRHINEKLLTFLTQKERDKAAAAAESAKE